MSSSSFNHHLVLTNSILLLLDTLFLCAYREKSTSEFNSATHLYYHLVNEFTFILLCQELQNLLCKTPRKRKKGDDEEQFPPR